MKKSTSNVIFSARFAKCCCALALMALPLQPASSLWAGTNAGRATACLTAMGETAEKGAFYFQAELKNGEKLSIPFAEKPVLKLTATECLISSDKSQVTLAYGDVERFVIVQQKDPTAIDQTVMAAEEMHRNGDVFTFSNCRAGSGVYAFDRSGRMVAKGMADENGYCQISLEGQPAGMYVIKSEFVNCKVLKK